MLCIWVFVWTCQVLIITMCDVDLQIGVCIQFMSPIGVKSWQIRLIRLTTTTIICNYGFVYNCSSLIFANTFFKNVLHCYCNKLYYEKEVTILAILNSCATTSVNFPLFIPTSSSTSTSSSASTFWPFFTSLYLFFLLTHSFHMSNTITQIFRYYDIRHSYSFWIHLLARYFN